MTQEIQSMTRFNNENDLVGSSQIREVTIDFTRHIDELDKAIQLTKDAGELANRVQEKGIWGTFKGKITGQNDKELAESVKILGASVETTQKIIEVILQVNNAKNQFLKSFHAALTEKILSLNKEMDITFGNQKNAKQATITIATQLRAQIEERIKQDEMVREHDLEISQLQELAKIKDKLDEDQSSEIVDLKNKAEIKEVVDIQQSQEISSLKELVAQNETLCNKLEKNIVRLNEISNTKDILDNQQSCDIIKHQEGISALTRLCENQSNEISLLKDVVVERDNFISNLAKDINTLDNKIELLQGLSQETLDKFNKIDAESNSVVCRLKRLALPLASMLLASAALLFAFK